MYRLGISLGHISVKNLEIPLYERITPLAKLAAQGLNQGGVRLREGYLACAT